MGGKSAPLPWIRGLRTSDYGIQVPGLTFWKAKRILKLFKKTFLDILRGFFYFYLLFFKKCS